MRINHDNPSANDKRHDIPALADHPSMWLKNVTQNASFE
jgi:hypothetical protein